MSTYENAPSTVMLATFCAVCARPLRDAVSVNLGIGPDCRKKYGYDLPVDEAARAEANALVHRIALVQMGFEVICAAAKLKQLGFERLAGIIIERKADVIVTESNGMLIVKSPYNEGAIDAFRRVPGRRWDKEAKLNTFPASSKRDLYAVLCRFYPGKVGFGPKGAFIIGATDAQLTLKDAA